MTASRSETVLITGASRGIGRATALLCARRGWNVAVNYRSDRAAAEATAEAARAAGAQAALVGGDVADPAAHPAMWDAAAEALGPVTKLVANAGVVAPPGRLAEFDADRMRRMLEVNLLGALLSCREAARRMARGAGGPGGAIVLVSSAAARLGGTGEWVDYAASKGALDTLTVGLARELAADGVRVNGVRPGLIDTEIHASAGAPDRPARLAPSIPMKRAGSAEEAAEAVVWLLSDAASYAAGAIIDVAGGR